MRTYITYEKGMLLIVNRGGRFFVIDDEMLFDEFNSFKEAYNFIKSTWSWL